MSTPATISPRIIEGLYCEALVLSDEVRAAFALSGRLSRAGSEEDLARVALSCEGLRTTTRMMHALAWLLNYRAYFLGEISEFQLRRYGRLASDHGGAGPDHQDMLDMPTRQLIAATERFYARLQRLDLGWREHMPVAPGAIERIRDRVSAATN